jgi:anti-sigma B factor antagonist
MTQLAEHPLTMRVVHDQDVTRIAPIGEMDMSSANTFETVADQVVRAHPARIELDMSRVDFIDSTGLRSLLTLRHRAEIEGVDLVISGLSAAAQRVLELTGLIDELRRV